MPYAICISCGSAKKRALTRCNYCGYDPVGDNLAMAKSLMLSTEWLTMDGKHHATKAELRRIQADIKRGLQPLFDADALAGLVAEKERWDRTPDVSWMRVIILILAILGIPGSLIGIALLIRWIR